MRIDRFTVIINVEDKTFLFNSKTGAIDEMEADIRKAGLYPANRYPANTDNLEQPETDITKEIIRLKKEGSFTPLECSLKDSLINEMIERGYITYYSDTEETDERKWFLGKYKEKAKKEKKTASLILDSFAADNWCFLSESENNKNAAMNNEEIINFLKVISYENLSDEIDLWLILKNRTSELAWIIDQASQYGLKIKSLYAIVEDEIELEEIKNWIKITPSAPKAVYIKYKKEEFEYFTITKVNGKIITKDNNAIFMNKHPFFCPFIYKTFFIDKTGSISYCTKKIVNKEQPVRRGVIGKIDHDTKKITFEHGWSNELFTANCDKSDSCNYSIYCNKMCPYLSCLYESSKNKNECGIIPIMKKLIGEKIRSMV